MVMLMRYKSTRNSQLRLEASQVIAQGISEEGGLFVPESFPDLSGELPALAKLDYPALAKAIFAKFLTDFTEAEIEACVSRAYTPEKFGGPCPVKLVPLSDGGEEKDVYKRQGERHHVGAFQLLRAVGVSPDRARGLRVCPGGQPGCLRGQPLPGRGHD